MAGTDKLSDGQRRLEESHRVALETEDLGANILGNLYSQRQQIENTRDTVGFLYTYRLQFGMTLLEISSIKPIVP